MVQTIINENDMEYIARICKTDSGTITGVFIQPTDWSFARKCEVVEQGSLTKCKDTIAKMGLTQYLDIAGVEYFDARVNKTSKKRLELEGR